MTKFLIFLQTVSSKIFIDIFPKYYFSFLLFCFLLQSEKWGKKIFSIFFIKIFSKNFFPTSLQIHSKKIKRKKVNQIKYLDDVSILFGQKNFKIYFLQKKFSSLKVLRLYEKEFWVQDQKDKKWIFHRKVVFIQQVSNCLQWNHKIIK